MVSGKRVEAVGVAGRRGGRSQRSKKQTFIFEHLLLLGTLLDKVHSFLHLILMAMIWGGNYYNSKPLYPQVPYPQIQPTMDRNVFSIQG